MSRNVTRSMQNLTYNILFSLCEMFDSQYCKFLNKSEELISVLNRDLDDFKILL